MGQAVFKQKSGLEALVLVGACGVVTPGQFKGLAERLDELGVAALKFTTRQTLVLLLPAENVAAACAAAEELGWRVGTFGNTFRNVKACCGREDLCPKNITEVLDLGIEIQDKYYGRPLPRDFKVALAGCARGCTDPYCADFGVRARQGGAYEVAVGGRGSTLNPRHGTVIAENISREGVFAVLEFVLEKYQALAKPKERVLHVIDRVGIEPFVPDPAWLVQYQVEKDEEPPKEKQSQKESKR
ncbi:NAD(P)/FAD-dependent oxidoreductase [Candidatus Desulforudis audaxviator]|uniref:Nitrite and sulphite reductase 4Fe-4S region n=1 Tax=Desulforudis audaxviator (strain MP104C) TaxID=477974 RepID=B1I3T0_DESAP|nr:nitrite reductase [Candidatus Desulforudis audaxviator]ACA59649.1 nitrite and sulphite reductase 4Fe-4S region [Candidatus Desulforudis audaxviator MP104C]AZK59640.1 Nitrite reductase [NAD(P)H] large subunit [Candidatus Desulforudis audaxviator]